MKIKHALKATVQFLKAKKGDILQWHSQSLDLNPREQTNKQQLKLAAVQVWQSISGEDTQHLVTPMGSTLQAVIDRKGFLSKY